jgi:hypothetical protein
MSQYPEPPQLGSASPAVVPSPRFFRKEGEMLKSIAFVLAYAISTTIAGAQTADELIAKNLAARGGEDRLAACNSIRMTGEVPTATGAPAVFVVEVKQPDKLLLEVTVGDRKNLQVINGASGWEVLGLAGQSEPKPLNEQQMSSLRLRANYRGELFDAKRQGTPAEYVGQTDLGGTPAHVLKLAKRNGDVVRVYLDTKSFLELKQEHLLKIGEYTVEYEVLFKDHGEVDGLVFSHNIGASFKGDEAPQWVQVKYAVNPEVADSRFAVPGATKP